MQYLYVCLFSNGHIKVGRSINPESRIAAHADRVSCMGIELVEHKTFPCVGNVIARESALISACKDTAIRQHKHEWFEGLEFELVVAFVERFAGCDESEIATPKDGVWRTLVEDLLASGMTQQGIAKACNCSQVAISELYRGVTLDPRHSTGESLVRLHKARPTAIAKKTVEV